MVAILSIITIVATTVTTQAHSQPKQIEVLRSTEAIMSETKPKSPVPNSQNPSAVSIDTTASLERHRHRTRSIPEVRIERHHQTSRNSIRHPRNQESVTHTTWIGDSELTGNRDDSLFIEGLQKNT